MKKQFYTFFLLAIIIVFVSSCTALHSGCITNSASLSTKNFQYVKMNAVGTSQATYLFGIGGLAKETLVHDALSNLYSSFPLGPNQALANTTVNFKRSIYLGVFMTHKCSVTADIVEFK